MELPEVPKSIKELQLPSDEKVTRIPARITLMLMRGFFIVLLILLFIPIEATNKEFIGPMITAMISLLSGAVGYQLKSVIDGASKGEE